MPNFTESLRKEADTAASLFHGFLLRKSADRIDELEGRIKELEWELEYARKQLSDYEDGEGLLLDYV